MLDEVTERWCEFFEEYQKDAVGEALERYPKDTKGIQIDYRSLRSADRELAEKVVTHPDKMLSKAANAIPQLNVPHVDQLEGITPRVSSLPHREYPINELRTEQQGELVTVRAQVSKATEIRPKAEVVKFKCERCPEITEVYVSADEIRAPQKCAGCERQGPFSILESESEMRDHQIVELQPRPDEDAMNLQRSLEVHLYDDLVDSMEAGDRVKVTGILETKPIQAGNKADARRPQYLKAHTVEKEQQDFESYDTDRVDEIKALAESDGLQEKLVQSIAPDILTGERGDTHKLAVMYQLFGGVRHQLPNGGEKRPDINILLIGAPGTGKSAYLSYADKLAPKSVKASGKGATAAGLTATATQPDFGDGWMLDAGALVMASGGLACIDEFDKMDDSARKSMHEAMEEQEIPINKAGINTTLTSKTAVLAAANPKDGRFNRYEPLGEQINLGDALISRFDLVFAIEDTPSESNDREIAKHQYNVANGEGVEPAIDSELLREYIAYARQNIDPQFSNQEAVDMLVDKYVDIRQTNKTGENDEDAPIPVTARMNESLRRLAEAAARSELSAVVKPKHAETAIELYQMTIGDVGLTDDGTLDAAKAGGYEEQGKWAAENNRERAEKVMQWLEEHGASDREEIISGLPWEDDKVDYAIDKAYDNGLIHEPQQGEYRAI